MKTKEAKKLKKGDVIIVDGEHACRVTAKDETGLAFMELKPEGITGVVNWPSGEDEHDFPAPQPIKHLSQCN